MQILALEHELAPVDPARDAKLLRAEAAAVWRLRKQEIIREIWFTRRGRLAVVLLECRDEAEAERHLRTLPLVRAKLIAFKLLPLMAYDGFDRLCRPLPGAEIERPARNPRRNRPR